MIKRKRINKSVSFPPELFEELQNIQELNNFHTFSETIVYLLQTVLDSRTEINRTHFDKCHADYMESLTIIRKIGTLLNTIIRNIYLQKIEPMEVNFEQLKTAILELEKQMKTATNHLIAIEKILNIHKKT